MTTLSPAAKAVRRDLAQIMHELHQRCRVSVSATDTLPITLETNDASLQAVINSLCAAALRAAADQAVPTEIDLPPIAPDLGHFRQHERRLTRQRLLAIAAELEQLNDRTTPDHPTA